MCYLSGALLHQNKFPVKFVGPSLFFLGSLVFYYLTDAFALVLVILSTSHPSTSSVQEQSFADVLQNSCS